MKNYFLAALCLFCFFNPESVLSQNVATPCASDYWRQKTLQEPDFFQKNQEYEHGILQVFQQHTTFSRLQDDIKILPTVIHIIHNGGVENISDAEAQQAITWGVVLTASHLGINQDGIVRLDSAGNVDWTRKYTNLQNVSFEGLAKFNDIGYLIIGSDGVWNFSGPGLKF